MFRIGLALCAFLGVYTVALSRLATSATDRMSVFDKGADFVAKHPFAAGILGLIWSTVDP